MCFVEAGPLSASETHRCAPALSILRPEAESVKRCALSADCGDHHLCVKPRSDERLLRIGVWIPGLQSSFERQDVPTDTSIVIWSGPREEILEEGGCRFITKMYTVADVSPSSRSRCVPAATLLDPPLASIVCGSFHGVRSNQHLATMTL